MNLDYIFREGFRSRIFDLVFFLRLLPKNNIFIICVDLMHFPEAEHFETTYQSACFALLFTRLRTTPVLIRTHKKKHQDNNANMIFSASNKKHPQNVGKNVQFLETK